MSIDVSRVYRERIEQIEKDVKIAIKHKNWLQKSQLEHEKQKLKKVLAQK